MSVNEKVQALAEALCAMEGVFAVARTDAGDEPVAGETDVDLFVYAEAIPPLAMRLAAYERLMFVTIASMEVCGTLPPERCDARGFFTPAQDVPEPGRDWGTGDVLSIDGVDVMPMYFTLPETKALCMQVCTGRRIAREGGFYPVGRLATLRHMRLLADDGRLAAMQDTLCVYPAALRDAVLSTCLPRLFDEEDFARARSRCDPLFLHQVLEDALDRFLQALFAMNGTFFPSRKRTLGWLAGFSVLPADCGERLLRIVRDSAVPDMIPDAIAAWRQLTDELCLLSEKQQEKKR